MAERAQFIQPSQGGQPGPAGVEPGVAPLPPGSRHRRWTAHLTLTDWEVVRLALLTEVLTLAFGVLAYELITDARVETVRDAFLIWNKWDGPQYLDIAQKGYLTTGDARFSIVFYPLYPWMIRALALLIRDPLISAFSVSIAASIFAALALARLTALDYPEPVAYQAVWFMFIFPSAYFLHIGYTESLFLALAIGSFLAARRERWLAASILGAAASLTRANGLLLAPALGIEAIHRRFAEGRWPRRWLWIALIPSGFGAYLMLNYHVTGNPFTFADYEWTHWNQGLTWPWRVFLSRPADFYRHSAYEGQMIGLQIQLYLAIGLTAALASVFTMRPSYSFWMLANWTLVASLTWDLSAPRYALIFFPMFIWFARLARNRGLYTIITFWSLLSMGVFSAYFLRGWWAF